MIIIGKTIADIKIPDSLIARQAQTQRLYNARS
uniref:Uncharacterized protein n=1 Tax=Sphingobacterium sp. (strain 21) TaxID=743722 RepID=F4CC31_SPHS2